MKVKFKKLHEDAVLPYYSKDGDAGLNMTTVTYPTWRNGDNDNSSYLEYKFGLSVEIPKGYVGLIFPRSSICNYDLLLSNSVGVIDSGYRGEIKARFKYSSVCSKLSYNNGDKIAQMIIIPIPKIEPQFADELSETERGEGGFGSTD